MFKDRRKNILQNISKDRFTAAVMFNPENVYYSTGFWGESVSVCTAENTKLFVPHLEVARAETESHDCEVIPTQRGEGLIESLYPSLYNRNACSDCNDFKTISTINSKVNKKNFVCDPDRFLTIRSIKDEDEINMIKQSSQILDKLYKICMDEIRIGMSEKDLQAYLVCEALKLDGSIPNYPFTLNPFIIGSGPNGAFPHAETSERPFIEGDFIVIDLTIRYGGYVSDATRTFALRNVTEEKKKICETVKEAQRRGIEKARSSTKCSDVDLECRRLIAKSGYGEYFIHSTGHGVGLEVHERPWIRPEDNSVLQNNMAITIEPGIYITSKFGVRIEDTIIVNNQAKLGNEILTKFTKDLIIIDR